MRIRSVDDVVLVFIEPEHVPTDEEMQRWYSALLVPGVRNTLVMSVGPVTSAPDRRRATVDVLKRQGIRLIAVSNHRHNRGLLGMFGWLGVPVTAYSWGRLEDAARDVASRPELVPAIVREALAMRAKSPAAAGLDPEEG